MGLNSHHTTTSKASILVIAIATFTFITQSLFSSAVHAVNEAPQALPKDRISIVKNGQIPNVLSDIDDKGVVTFTQQYQKNDSGLIIDQNDALNANATSDHPTTIRAGVFVEKPAAGVVGYKFKDANKIDSSFSEWMTVEKNPGQSEGETKTGATLWGVVGIGEKDSWAPSEAHTDTFTIQWCYGGETQDCALNDPLQAEVLTINVVDKSTVVDGIKPILTIGSPTLDSDGKYRIAGTTTDADARVYISICGAKAVEESTDVVATQAGIRAWSIDVGELTANQTCIFVATSTDAAGNVADPKILSFKVPSVNTDGLNVNYGLPLPNTDFSSPLVRGSVQAFSSQSPIAAAQVNDTTAAPEVQGRRTGIGGGIVAIAPSASGWQLFGLAWYWWLFVAVVASATWWRIAGRRHKQEA